MIAVYLLYMFDRNSGGKTFQTELLFDYYSIIFELYTQKSKLIPFLESTGHFLSDETQFFETQT